MQLKAIHFEWSIVIVKKWRKLSGGNHDKRPPEDADVKPPRFLLLSLGGFSIERHD
jgi:hypothetical protein